MSRSLLCTALLLGVVAALAIVTIALTGRDGAAAPSPIVSTYESSGLDVRSDQVRRDTLAAPNYTLDGPGAVSPDPYHPTPPADCRVPYQTTAGGKTVLKYGTIEGCATEAAPRQTTGSGTRA